ncbi:MAG: O-antigen ligase family protein [Acidiferrobacteraceae bacterium]
MALAFSIPISTFMDGTLIGLIFLASMVSLGRHRIRVTRISRNVVALAALMLLAMVFVGTLYGEGSLSARMNYAGKYADLLLIPLLMSVLKTDPARQRVVNAFLVAMMITLVLSLMVHFGWVVPGQWIKGTASDATPFKDHITQNILMSYAAFIVANQVLSRTDWTKWAALAIVLVCLYDILFAVQGRTGYLVLLALIPYLFYDRIGARGIGVAAVVVVVLSGAAYGGSPVFRQRMDLAAQQVEGWQRGHDDNTAVGVRLQYYKNTLRIIARHPLLGVGTGGFPRAYAREVAGTQQTPTANPHNQYLLLAAEIGPIGLGLFLALLYAEWRMAGSMMAHERRMARALVLTFAVANVVNSLLIDQTERVFFCVLSGTLFSTIFWAERRN